MSDLERRFTAGEVRADVGVTDFSPVIRGYALVYLSLSGDLGGFREQIHPDAIKRTLAEGIDVRSYVDHEPSRIIGRLSAGTLRLKPDAHGLGIEVDVPNTTAGRDIAENVRLRNVTGMSFSFRTMEDGDTWERRNGQMIRTLHDIRIYETGPVGSPAYSDTTAAVRSLARFTGSGKTLAMAQREHRQRVAGWR